MTSFEDKLGEVLLEYDLLPSQATIGRKFRVYKNTSTRNVKQLIEDFKEIGGMLAGGDLYLWNRDDMDHDGIMRNYGIDGGFTRDARNPITFYIIKGVLLLSPNSYFGVDPFSDMEKVQKSNPALSKLDTNMSYYENKKKK
jgi:hypothetical protein